MDVLDRFDEVLARAVSRVAPPKMDGGFKQPAPVVPESCKIENLPGNQNSSNDMDTSDKNISVPNFSIALEHNPLLKNLAIEVIQFTRLLVEYSCSRHIYNSIESVLDLLLATDFNVILPVLNLLYIFAKRSNYLGRMNLKYRESLCERLSILAEDWGGKDNGMALVDCCSSSSSNPNTSSNPVPSVLNVRYEIADGENIIAVDIPDIRQGWGNNPNETMQEICKKWPVVLKITNEKLNHLFARVRLAWAFADDTENTTEHDDMKDSSTSNSITFSSQKHLCIEARLHAMSVLVYTKNSSISSSTTNSCIYSGFVEESVEVLKMNNNTFLLPIKSAVLRTITSMVHLNLEDHRLGQIIDATGLAEYHGYLPMLVRKCIAYMIEQKESNENGENSKNLKSKLSQAYSEYTTSLFSLLYHMASTSSPTGMEQLGSEALISSGMLDSMLKVIEKFDSSPEPIMFVTRAVRIVDLITNYNMSVFQNRSGIDCFIDRLSKEIDICKVDQPFCLVPKNKEYISDETDQLASGSGSSSSSSAAAKISKVNTNSQTAEDQCMPQRSALLKSILNFLKNKSMDDYESKSTKIMDTTLPKSMRHIISNCHYYGPSLFLLSIDLLSKYIQKDPSQLSSIQETGLTDVILQALCCQDIPASKETLTCLPNLCTALCMNEAGLNRFLEFRPFEKIFRIFIKQEYLGALKKKRSSNNGGLNGLGRYEGDNSIATQIGNSFDDMTRHHQKLEVPVIDALNSLLDDLVIMSQDPDIIVVKGSSLNGSSNSGQNTNNSTKSSSPTCNNTTMDENSLEEDTSMNVSDGNSKIDKNDLKQVPLRVEYFLEKCNETSFFILFTKFTIEHRTSHKYFLSKLSNFFFT